MVDWGCRVGSGHPLKSQRGCILAIEPNVNTSDHPLESTIDQLKAIRSRIGYSQSDLEEIAGFPAGRIGHWEAGRNKPSLASLIIWAEALGCRLILGGSPVPDPGSAKGEYALLTFMHSRHITIKAST